MIYTYSILLIRVLKKIKVLKYITVTTSIIFNGKKATVLIRKEVGYPNLFIEEDFLLGLLQLYLPKKTGIFIDAGVNIGQTLLKIKTVDKSRKYIGFEPNRVCVEYTKELIRINNYTNCDVRKYALSDRSKKIKLALNEETDASASIVENLRPDYFRDSILVDCIAFDEAGITEPIAIVKIDVEGAELEVIRGMQKAIDAFHPLIICEVLDCYSVEVLEFTQKRADYLCRLLRTHGYIIFRLHQDNKGIKKFELVESITINSWSPASYKLNDYLFCHAEFETGMVGILNQLSTV